MLVGTADYPSVADWPVLSQQTMRHLNWIRHWGKQLWEGFLDTMTEMTLFISEDRRLGTNLAFHKEEKIYVHPQEERKFVKYDNKMKSLDKIRHDVTIVPHIKSQLCSHPNTFHHVCHSYRNYYIQKSCKLNPTANKEVSSPACKLFVSPILHWFYTCSDSSSSVHIFAFNVHPESWTLLIPCWTKMQGTKGHEVRTLLISCKGLFWLWLTVMITTSSLGTS